MRRVLWVDDSKLARQRRSLPVPCDENLHSSNVGAGLLAKAVGQSTSSPSDTPPSRASPLPHLIGCVQVEG
ncbi:hypothetical protein EAH78_13180 [Pseudomonas arsenicoxydans]|uniref:Uncharacterized protein n=1 Tax=Pseudomonas arsenicoxydans TaxID=702115 RepID=A0A502HZ67_9PSED|nr:hypothetical protein EAH78_13180 [Pseudomonas arsenicoxydans]